VKTHEKYQNSKSMNPDVNEGPTWNKEAFSIRTRHLAPLNVK